MHNPQTYTLHVPRIHSTPQRCWMHSICCSVCAVYINVSEYSSFCWRSMSRTLNNIKILLPENRQGGSHCCTRNACRCVPTLMLMILPLLSSSSILRYVHRMLYMLVAQRACAHIGRQELFAYVKQDLVRVQAVSFCRTNAGRILFASCSSPIPRLDQVGQSKWLVLLKKQIHRIRWMTDTTQQICFEV